MLIKIQTTPNPDAVKFVVGQKWIEFVWECSSQKEAQKSPLARKLWEIRGISYLMFGSDFVSVVKNHDEIWEILQPEIVEVISEFLLEEIGLFSDVLLDFAENGKKTEKKTENGEKISAKNVKKNGKIFEDSNQNQNGKIAEIYLLNIDKTGQNGGVCEGCFVSGSQDFQRPERTKTDIEKCTDLEQKIIKVLDEKVQPALEFHGGWVNFVDFSDGILRLEMQGACRGCPSAFETLKDGIENLMKYYFPEISEVREITMENGEIF